MGLDRSARVIRDGAAATGGMPLSPTDFFVLSRIEGPITVTELLHGSGIPVAEAEAVLTRLIDLGIARLVAAPTPMPVATSDRKRRTLVQQMEFARTPNERRIAAELPQDDDEGDDDAPPDREPPEWPRVGDSDPRILSTLALPRDEQRRILGLVDRLDDLSPYEILGMWPTHDLRLVRRAYHRVSREFHPDSYFGQNLGKYREHLASLFRRATQAAEALRDPELRTPFVDAEIARAAEDKRRAQELDAAQRKQQELREAQIEAEAAGRRYERAAARAQRQRAALGESVRRQLDAHIAEANEAEKAGNLARAANSWRLALQLHAGDVELKRNWDRCRDLARARRAAEAFSRAMSLRELGQPGEAVALLVEAADAHGTAEHLAHAAEALGTKDPARTRTMALAALDALSTDQTADPNKRKPADLARLHVLLARAFLAAGQQHTAREQAAIADRHRPNDPEIRALLISIKLP